MKNQETLDSIADSLLQELESANTPESMEKVLDKYKQVLNEYSEHLFYGFRDGIGNIEADIKVAKRYKSVSRREHYLNSARAGLKSDIKALKTEVSFKK